MPCVLKIPAPEQPMSGAGEPIGLIGGQGVVGQGQMLGRRMIRFGNPAGLVGHIVFVPMEVIDLHSGTIT